jgi:ATP-dependent Lon protease
MSDEDKLVNEEGTAEPAEAGEAEKEAIEADQEADILRTPSTLPVLPLKDTVVFPDTMMPLAVGQPRSVRLIDDILQRDKLVALVTVRNEEPEVPGPEDLYELGTLAVIQKMIKAPDGTLRVIVQGIRRVRIHSFASEEPYLVANVSDAPDVVEEGKELEALQRNLVSVYTKIIGLVPYLPDELEMAAANIEDPATLGYFIASTMRIKTEEKQELLEEVNLSLRLRKLTEVMARELEVLELGSKIQNEVQSGMEKTQREYFLRQQMKAIQDELGEADETQAEINELRDRLEEAKLPEEADKQARRELDRLAKLPAAAAEYGVIRTYLDWILSLPWNLSTEDNLDIAHARQILDEDHYDLEDVKDRLLEFLAVQKLKREVRSPILALVGPPGVGKTSLGQSIARALGRKFIRISVGGVRDEAEIRGHRRTYIGAMPGTILRAIRDSGSNNPVFMIDEIDKMGSDWRGDPSSAMLEVLDPEQHDTFRDHYLDLPFDLSRVMFVTTANMLDTIPGPLRDRMEIISIAGYTEEDKLRIARQYLIPRQLERHGLSSRDGKVAEGQMAGVLPADTSEPHVADPAAAMEQARSSNGPQPAAAEQEGGDGPAAAEQDGAPETVAASDSGETGAEGGAGEPPVVLEITDSALRKIIQGYTAEAGVRGLERQIGTIARKFARVVAEDGKTSLTVDEDDVQEFLGKQKVFKESKRRTSEPGVSTGLAWTPVGGDILFIEARAMPGSSKLTLTGQLGDVMKESAQAGLTYIRSIADRLSVPGDYFQKHDIHVHVPAGAIPKDGPSAGVAMTVALASMATNRPVNADFAMTGEVTLTGQVLPVGGIKDKVLAAHRAGIRKVLLPNRNEADVAEIKEELIKEVEFFYLDHVSEAIERVLEGPLPPATTQLAECSSDGQQETPKVEVHAGPSNGDGDRTGA